jgi:hypothetical protein
MYLSLIYEGDDADSEKERMYVSMYEHTYVCMYIYIHMYVLRTCDGEDANSAEERMYECMYVCVHVHTDFYVCASVCIYVCTYIRMYHGPVRARMQTQQTYSELIRSTPSRPETISLL